MTKRKTKPKKPKGEKWEAKQKCNRLLDKCHKMGGRIKYLLKDRDGNQIVKYVYAKT